MSGKRTAVLASPLLCVVLARCGDAPSPQPTPTPTSTLAASPSEPATVASTSTPSATIVVVTATTTATAFAIPAALLYPAGTRAGDAAIDRLLEAWAAGDAPALSALMRSSAIPCGTAFGEPRCEGQPTGTPVEVFPTGNCSPLFITLDEARSRLGKLAKERTYALYAIYQKPERFGPPATAATVLFAAFPIGADVLQVDIDANGNVVRFQGTCGNPAAAFNFEDFKVILPPRTP